MPDMPPLTPRYSPRRRMPQASSTARGYDERHKRIRRAVLAEQNGLCAWCQNAFATDLHHKDGNVRNRDRSNLVGLCEPCHHGIAHAGH